MIYFYLMLDLILRQVVNIIVFIFLLSSLELKFASQLTGELKSENGGKLIINMKTYIQARILH